MISISNHGPLITAANYWESPLAERGLVFCSVNAGAIRVLLPAARYGDLNDMRTAKYCILSRGPWTVTGLHGLPGAPYAETTIIEGIEIMWEDHSDSPYVLHLTPESFDLLPAEPKTGREWIVSTWMQKDGKPHKSLERICHWRRVDKIPYLKPWEK